MNINVVGCRRQDQMYLFIYRGEHWNSILGAMVNLVDNPDLSFDETDRTACGDIVVKNYFETPFSRFN